MPSARSWAAAAALLAVLLGTTLLYWNGLNGPFLLDDGYNIPQTEIDSLSWQELSQVVFANQSGMLLRPVSVLSFALNNYFGGSQPFGFKFVNLMLHLLCALLLFWFGGRLLAHMAGDATVRPRAWAIAGVAAIIWAVHPMQVSTILYAVQRMAMLATMFNVAALLSYLVIRQRLVEGRPGLIPGVLMLAMFSLLGILSKETGVLIVVYILALEIALFRPGDLAAQTRQRLYTLVGLTSLLPIALGAAYFFTHTESLLAEYANLDFSLTERLMTQPGVLWFYLKLMLLPDITQMSVFHDDYRAAAPDLVTILQLLSIPVAIVVAVAIRTRFAPISLGILWFLASHAIESTVLPLELVFEHRNYLALWGVFFALACYLTPDSLAGRGNQLRAACLAAIGAIAVFQTSTRVHTWSDEHLLAAITAREHPDSARARNTYSHSLLRRQQVEEALEEARAAERLDPRSPGYTLSVLMIECILDRVSRDTIERARDKLVRHPVNGHAGAMLLVFKDVAINEECASIDRRMFLYVASGIGVFAARDHNNVRRAASLAIVGLAQSLLPDTRDEAIETFEASFSENPQNIVPLVTIGLLQTSAGEFQAARDTLERARIQNTRNIVDNSELISALESTLERAENPGQTAGQHRAASQERSE